MWWEAGVFELAPVLEVEEEEEEEEEGDGEEEEEVVVVLGAVSDVVAL